jgi:glycosyl transferase family 2
MAPLLSICLPTHNRAGLLRLALRSLLPQVAARREEVELVVSDNASTDDTPEVLAEARALGPFRHYRNPVNLGVTRNILVLTQELAKGEYGWILGDDDMLVRGGLDRLVGVLKDNADLDHVFVNYFFKPVAFRDELIRDHDSSYAPALEECMCRDFSERRVARWEDTLGIPSFDPTALFTAVISHVFRLARWRQHAHRLDTAEERPWSRLDTTFPHVKVLAYAMVGRPAYYLGQPLVLLGQGSQEWSGHWPVMAVVRLAEALDLYESLGVDPRRVHELRRVLLRRSAPYVAGLVADPDAPGREDFSLAAFLWRNRGQPVESARVLAGAWRAWTARRLPPPLYRAMRLLRGRPARPPGRP